MQVAQAEDNFNRKASTLREKFLDKLMILVKGKESNGVNDLYGAEIIVKGAIFTREKLDSIDYENINPTKWTADKNANALIKQLINILLISGV